MTIRAIWVATGFCLFGLLVAIYAFNYPMMNGPAPGTGFMPLILGVVMFLASGADVLQSWRHKSMRSVGTRAEKSALAIMGSSLLYVLLLQAVGYAVATAAFSLVMLRALSRYSWPTTVLVSLVIAIGFYMVFEQLLGLVLPPALIRL